MSGIKTRTRDRSLKKFGFKVNFFPLFNVTANAISLFRQQVLQPNWFLIASSIKPRLVL